MKKVLLQLFIIILFVTFFILILIGFILLIPNANSIKDRVYLEKWERASGYEIEVNEGELISWEFRTYNNSFTVYFRFREWTTIFSHDKTANRGIIEVFETNTYGFSFENIGHTGGGFLEFEVKVIARIPGYYPSITLMIVSFISFISILTIKLKKKLRINILNLL